MVNIEQNHSYAVKAISVMAVTQQNDGSKM